MNFRQIQLLEYSFLCLQEIMESKVSEEDKPNYELVIQSSDDIFIASSFQLDRYGKPYFSLPRNADSFYYTKKPVAYRNLENNHPLLKVRHIIYETFKDFYFFEDSLIVDEPSLLVTQMQNLIKEVEDDFESNQGWYNYESLINNLKFEFNLKTDDEYKVISLKS